MPSLLIHYATSPGEQVVVRTESGRDLPMRWNGAGWWQTDVPADLGRYRYVLVETTGAEVDEPGPWRSMDASWPTAVHVDRWKQRRSIDRAVSTSAFTRVLRRRPPRPFGSPPSAETKVDESSMTVRFRLFAPDLDPDRRIVVVGDTASLGRWDPVDGVALSDEHFPWWTADVRLDPAAGPFDYKYAVVGGERGGVVWEGGPNRRLPRLRPGAVVMTDQDLAWRGRPWRGAGVAIPLFSVRVRSGAGVGRFSDLVALIDWAAAAGFRLVQLLPINDTTLTHDSRDSYPYSPISSVALHPMYLDTREIGPIDDTAIRAERARLEAAPGLDHEALMVVLWKELRLLYARIEPRLRSMSEFVDFTRDEADWLDPYAAFCALRDRHGPDRAAWGRHDDCDRDALAELEATDPEFAADARFHRWIQWELHRQLRRAVDHARARGVILKGDLPIGVSPDSVDVWEAPDLFDTTARAGAPPDDFSAAGQNWLFPIYRWDVMARDGYAWWHRRLTSMAMAFDAYRIDHVLGFFRIWQVPVAQYEGAMGRFEPCLPLSAEEIRDALGWFDRERLCDPTLTTAVLAERLGERFDTIVARSLRPAGDDRYELAEGWTTQADMIGQLGIDHPDLPATLALAGQVLAFPVTDVDGELLGYHPRVDPDRTAAFAALGEEDRHAWRRLAEQFFHHRHAALWEQRGRTTLPAVLDASDLLVCGEDLGMVADFVPGVLRELGVLSLEIERMPKRLGVDIADPALAPELSVVSTGTHDMPTLRVWWETERRQAAEAWRALGRTDPPPEECTPEVADTLVTAHLRSPAMWAILPIQDLLAIDGGLRHPDPEREQINVPANPRHVWDYRLHVDVDTLRTHPVTARLRQMIVDSGRSTP